METPLWIGIAIIPSGRGTKEKYCCSVCFGSKCFVLIGLNEDVPKKCLKEEVKDGKA